MTENAHGDQAQIDALSDLAKAQARRRADEDRIRRLYDERVNLVGYVAPTPIRWDEPVEAQTPAYRTSWDIVKFGHAVSVGRFARESAQLEDRPRFDLRGFADRDLIRALTVAVLADKLPPERITETVPVVFRSAASPWQMFKLDHDTAWWLRWLVRRRPPVMTTYTRMITVTVDLNRWRTFPEADVPYPKEFGPARFHATWETHSRITDPTS